MRIVLTTFLAFFVALAMISCSDDNGVNIIDVGNGNDGNGNGGEEELGTVYSITFNVDGGGTYTFSVDMDGATIEGDDLPDDFDGDVYTFDPDNDKVFISGSMLDEWYQPGTQGNLQLTLAGASPGITVDAGPAQFKFFIVPPGVTNDDGDNATWGYGEWKGDPNRSVEIESDGDYFDDWGNKPEVEEPAVPDGEFIEVLYVAGNFQGNSGYGGDWSPADAPQIGFHGDPFVNDGYVFFAEEGAEFKLVHTNEWGQGDFGGSEGTLTNGGANIEADAAGFTRINVNQADMTYTLTVTEWGIIGDATEGGWDASTAMEFDPETKLWTITADLGEGQMKFRANDSWDINFGSNDADGTLQYGGGNIPVEEAGNYTITLDLNGLEYTYTVTLNEE